MNTRIRKRNQRHTKVNRGSKRMRRRTNKRRTNKRRTNKRRTNKRRTNKRRTIRGGMEQPLTRHEQLQRQQKQQKPMLLSNSTESMKEQERRLKKMMDDAKAAKAAEKQRKKMMDDAKAAEAAEKEWKKEEREEAARQSRAGYLLAQQKARLILAEEFKREEEEYNRNKEKPHVRSVTRDEKSTGFHLSLEPETESK